MCVTLPPWGANSWDRPSHKAASANLLIQEGVPAGMGIIPNKLPTTTMRPRVFCSSGSAANRVRRTPKTLVSSWWRQSSRVRSTSRPPTEKPAFATATSKRPNLLRARSTARSGSPSRVTSPVMASELWPPLLNSLANASMRSARRAISTVWAPSRANSRANAAPIPEDAPVISTTWPWNLPACKFAMEEPFSQRICSGWDWEGRPARLRLPRRQPARPRLHAALLDKDAQLLGDHAAALRLRVHAGSHIRPICADSDGHRSPRANQASEVLTEQHARESLKTQGPSFTPARQGAFNPAQARNLKASPERVCFLGGLGGAWRLLKNSREYPLKIKHFPPGVLSQNRPVLRTGPCLARNRMVPGLAILATPRPGNRTVRKRIRSPGFRPLSNIGRFSVTAHAKKIFPCFQSLTRIGSVFPKPSPVT